MSKIKSALISVYHKDGLAPVVQALHELNVTIYSTGGTQKFIEEQGVPVIPVEDLTSYPSILDGRVKTLHPKVFGGILARREEEHLQQLNQYEIPAIDLVIVDLYPFEETVAQTNDESAIIEKIDIGGISLIRAAAKNYKDVLIIPSMDSYGALLQILTENKGISTREERKAFAKKAFMVSSHYDTAIFNYFNEGNEPTTFKQSIHQTQILRYGENPHQKGQFFGNIDELFDKLNGKELSYNNLVDVDAAVNLMEEFKEEKPAFAILKHTNVCGLAIRDTIFEAWTDALAGDNISAFGGILISNTTIDFKTAEAIDKLFYEVLIAPDFDEYALDLLTKKKKRILLKIKKYPANKFVFKSLLNGVIHQEADTKETAPEDIKTATKIEPTTEQLSDLLFANKLVKHLKSNTIVLAKNKQLIGMGCGQTSRVDALNQSIIKAHHFGFDTKGAVMASDAFFPFPDCVEIANMDGITAVIQPGGSIKDQLSVDYCDKHGMAMVMTGTRHFKH